MPRLNVGNATLCDTMIVAHDSVLEFDRVKKLIKWPEIQAILSDVYPSKEGGASYPPMLMFRAIWIWVWGNKSVKTTVPDQDAGPS